MKSACRILSRVGLLVVALVVAPGRVNAEDRDPAAAQALFDESRKLSSAGRYTEACAKLTESNRLDPGIGTQFHLADCQEKSGRVASAWATFLEVASQARASAQSDREKAALKRAAVLEAKLPKLRIDVPEASRVNGLEIRRDGQLVGSAQWGSPLPVDPGDHELVATAPGRRTLVQKVRADLGKTANLELPLLEVDPTSTIDGGVSPQAFVAVHDEQAPAAGSASSNPAPRKDASADGGGSNPWPYVLGGIGVVGIGIGTTFAFMASSTNKDSKAECSASDPNTCNRDGVELRNEALTKGNVATVGFAVGGAALAGAGIWLLFDSGGSSSKTANGLRPSAVFVPGRVALGLSGNFD